MESYVLACLALHNYLRCTDNASYTPVGFVDSESGDGSLIHGDWRKEVSTYDNGLGNINPVRGSRPRLDAINIRDALKEFFNSEAGSVEWQLQYVRRTSHNC